jgi:beta-glucosidase
MKFKAMLLGLSVITALPAFAQKPVYLDTGKPIEERVKDALNRMTLEEKVKMIHAQSKFSSAGVPRLGIPEVWATDGPHGIRPEVLWDEWDQAGWTNDSCIAYPALTCLSATWNPEMSHLQLSHVRLVRARENLKSRTVCADPLKYGISDEGHC